MCIHPTAIVGSSADLTIVSLDDGIGNVDKSGSGVGNGVDTGGFEWSASDGITTASELPETLRVIDIDVGDWAGTLAGVDGTEVIGTSSMIFEIGCVTERRLSIIEGGFFVLRERLQ